MQADRDKITRNLKTARGQIDGILRMIDEDRYCLDISHQIMAASALLSRANKDILAAHMRHCVYDAARNGDEEKIEEMITILEQIMK